MRINDAATKLAVFWTLVILSHEGQPHIVKNILVKMGKIYEPSPLPDEDTVSKALDYFERFGAVVFDYSNGRNDRRGRKDTAKLNPYKIPREVFRKRLTSRTTKHEWGKRLDESREEFNGQAFTIWKDGVRVFNGDSLTEKMKTPLRGIFDGLVPYYGFVLEREKPPELDFDWLMREIHGKPFNLDGKFLTTFYRYILLQFMFTYPHDWENAPYKAEIERTQEMFRRSVSFRYPNIYVEFALDRGAITLKHKGAQSPIGARPFGVFRRALSRFVAACQSRLATLPHKATSTR